MTAIADAARELADDFALLEDWEARFAYILDLGRALPALPEAERIEANKVRGCASQVWLTAALDEGGRLRLRAESDALLVRGLLAIVLKLFDGRSPQEILAVDAGETFRALGLAEALTPQRSNGLASVVARVRREAEAHRAP